MAYNSDEIRGVMIQVGDDRLLLPNATVAEVLAIRLVNVSVRV